MGRPAGALGRTTGRPGSASLLLLLAAKALRLAPAAAARSPSSSLSSTPSAVDYAGTFNFAAPVPWSDDPTPAWWYVSLPTGPIVLTTTNGSAYNTVYLGSGMLSGDGPLFMSRGWSYPGCPSARGLAAWMSTWLPLASSAATAQCGQSVTVLCSGGVTGSVQGTGVGYFDITLTARRRCTPNVPMFGLSIGLARNF